VNYDQLRVLEFVGESDTVRPKHNGDGEFEESDGGSSTNPNASSVEESGSKSERTQRHRIPQETRVVSIQSARNQMWVQSTRTYKILTFVATYGTRS
jgi:hypothetical protein